MQKKINLRTYTFMITLILTLSVGCKHDYKSNKSTDSGIKKGLSYIGGMPKRIKSGIQRIFNGGNEAFKAEIDPMSELTRYNNNCIPKAVPVVHSIATAVPVASIIKEEPIYNASPRMFKRNSEGDLQFEPNNTEDLKNAIAQLGGDPMAIDQMECFLGKNMNKTMGHGSRISKTLGKCKMILSDYTMGAALYPKDVSDPYKRMFLIDKCKGTVKQRYVAYGSGEGKRGSGYPQIDGRSVGASYNTPSGFMIVGGQKIKGSNQDKKPWDPSIYLHGLERKNKNLASPRAVLLHRATYAFGGQNTVNEAYSGMSNRTWGCSGVSDNTYDDVKNDFIDPKNSIATRRNGNLKEGPLMYNYSSYEKSKGKDYCGEI